MIIYGTALLAVSYLLGVFLGGLLGKILGVEANIGGVAIAMILLIVGKELLAKKAISLSLPSLVFYTGQVCISLSLLLWLQGQNVVAALSGGMVAAVVSVIALTATVFVVRWLNSMDNDYDTFTWDDTEEPRDQL